MKCQRPTCIPEQPLAQLDHGLLFAIGAVNFSTMDPRREPGRLSPIDPLGQPRQIHDPLDEEFLDRIARHPTKLPGISLFLVFPEILGGQNQDIGAAAVVQGIELRPILAGFAARAGALLAVPTICFNLRLGGHGDYLPPKLVVGSSRSVHPGVSGTCGVYKGLVDRISKQHVLRLGQMPTAVAHNFYSLENYPV
jgi:hypothetical protein